MNSKIVLTRQTCVTDDKYILMEFIQVLEVLGANKELRNVKTQIYLENSDVPIHTVSFYKSTEHSKPVTDRKPIFMTASFIIENYYNSLAKLAYDSLLLEFKRDYYCDFIVETCENHIFNTVISVGRFYYQSLNERGDQLIDQIEALMAVKTLHER